jgi:hypothetical protein
MFAAASPEFNATQLAAWLGIASFLAFLVNQLFTMKRNVIGRPLPAEVQADSAARFQPKGDYATRGELLALTGEIQKMKTESDKSRDDLRTHLDTALNDVRVELATKIDDQAREFGQALRDQPNQIVALLRNTGALS